MKLLLAPLGAAYKFFGSWFIVPSKRPLGLFDSGVGGLTVAREVFTSLPRERIIYFGDTLHVPYGGRSTEQLISFADAICAFLVDQGVKMIIDACNSTSSVALDYLRAKYEIPIIGVVEPGVRAALRITRNGHIGVIATEATINSQAHRRAAERLDSSIKVSGVASPLLVPLVEKGIVDSEETYLALVEYLAPLQAKGIDTLILGCTHYPYVAHLVRKILGTDVSIVDPAQEVIKDTSCILREMNLMAESGRAVHRYFVSSEPQAFRRSAEGLLGRSLPVVELARIEGKDFQCP